MQKPCVSQYSQDPYYFNYVSKGFCSVLESVTVPIFHTYKAVENFCFDGNHPWKQAKYEHTLEQILLALAPTLEKSKSGSSYCAKVFSEIIDMLNQPSEDHRTKHKSLISTLREVLLSSAFQEEIQKKRSGDQFDPAIDDLIELCYVIYHDNYLYSFCQSLITRVISLGNEQLGTKSPAQLSLEGQHRAIRKAPSSIKAPRAVILLNNLLGSLNMGFDPHTWGNIPYVLFDFKFFDLDAKFKKMVRFLRMPTPTLGSSSGYEANVIPEFLGYLLAAAKKKEKHTYISMQSQTKGLDAVRTTALKSLCSVPQLADSFNFIVLDQDSEFYHQIGEFAKCNSASEFLQIFFDLMIENENSNFFFPKSMREDNNFRCGVANLLSLIHKGFFYGKKNLSDSERRDFIELYYPPLIIFILRFTQADSVNITCKDGLDRAGKVIALLVKMLMIATNEKSNKGRQQLTTMIHSAAFLAKKQALNNERFERLVSAFKRLENINLETWLLVHNKMIGIDSKEKMQIKEHSGQQLTS